MDLHLALEQHCIQKCEKFFNKECCMICKPFLFFEEAWFKASIVEVAKTGLHSETEPGRCAIFIVFFWVLGYGISMADIADSDDRKAALRH